MKIHGKHRYLEFLEYVNERESFTQTEACEHLGIKPPDFDRYIMPIAQLIKTTIRGPEEPDWEMTYEAWLNYLEYIELKEARESSKLAYWMALIAILISTGMALIQIVIAVLTL